MNNWLYHYLFLVLTTLIFFSCKSNVGYSYRSNIGKDVRKPIANVEKAWMARHNYDHERRLLVPMVGGTRWGAIQEYKEDGTIEYRDWWVRDVKMEDLDPTPSTSLGTLPQKKSPQKAFTLDQIVVDTSSTENTTEAVEPEETILDEPLPTNEVEEIPIVPLPFESLPTEKQEGEAIMESPFAPLPPL